MYAKSGDPVMCQAVFCRLATPCWRVRLSSQGRCSEGNPLLLPRKIAIFNVSTGKQDLPHLTFHTKSNTEHEQTPFPSFLIICCGWCQRPDTRLDGPMVCSATQFLYSCVTLLFLFYLFCVCLLCSLVELEKEVNNIKTGLKAVEAVSI